jgi:hypothetical protein
VLQTLDIRYSHCKTTSLARRSFRARTTLSPRYPSWRCVARGGVKTGDGVVVYSESLQLAGRRRLRALPISSAYDESRGSRSPYASLGHGLVRLKQFVVEHGLGTVLRCVLAELTAHGLQRGRPIDDITMTWTAAACAEQGRWDVRFTYLRLPRRGRETCRAQY